METSLLDTCIKPDLLMHCIHWRYATKVFDKEKKVSEAKLNVLLETLRLSPSSLNLQPWKFVVVNDPKVRSKLRRYSMQQPQITDASHLVVLCSRTKIDAAYVDHLMEIEKSQEESKASLERFRAYVLSYIASQTKNELYHWLAEQTYIALGFLLSVCAMMHIDACPIEAFNREKFNEVLDLDQWELEARTAVAIGYRSANDPHARDKKVRLHKEEVILTI